MRSLCRRVDVHLPVDCAWPRFTQAADAFVAAVLGASDLVDLLEALHNPTPPASNPRSHTRTSQHARHPCALRLLFIPSDQHFLFCCLLRHPPFV
jgi:hypothetical protein